MSVAYKRFDETATLSKIEAKLLELASAGA